jgi:hypothetical protein
VIPFGCQTLAQNVIPSVFQFGKNGEITGGSVWQVGTMGNNNHVVSHKLCGFQGCVGWRIVVMKGPVVVVPKFCSFSSTFSLEHLKMPE